MINGMLHARHAAPLEIREVSGGIDKRAKVYCYQYARADRCTYIDGKGRLVVCMTFPSFVKGVPPRILWCKFGQKQPAGSGQPRTPNGIIKAREIASGRNHDGASRVEKRKVSCYRAKSTDKCTYMNEYGQILNCITFPSLKKGSPPKVIWCGLSKKQPAGSGHPGTTNGIIHARDIAPPNNHEGTGGLHKHNFYCWRSKSTDPCSYVNELGRLLDCKPIKKGSKALTCTVSEKQPGGSGYPGTTNGIHYARHSNFSGIKSKTTAEYLSGSTIGTVVTSNEANHDVVKSAERNLMENKKEKMSCDAIPLQGTKKRIISCGHSKTSWLCLTDVHGSRLSCEKAIDPHRKTDWVCQPISFVNIKKHFMETIAFAWESSRRCPFNNNEPRQQPSTAEQLLAKPTCKHRNGRNGVTECFYLFENGQFWTCTLDKKMENPSRKYFGHRNTKRGSKYTRYPLQHDPPYNPGRGCAKFFCLPTVGGSYQECLYGNNLGHVRACFFQIEAGSHAVEDHPTNCKSLINCTGKTRRSFLDENFVKDKEYPKTFAVPDVVPGVIDEEVQHNLLQLDQHVAKHGFVPTNWKPSPSNYQNQQCASESIAPWTLCNHTTSEGRMMQCSGNGNNHAYACMEIVKKPHEHDLLGSDNNQDVVAAPPESITKRSPGKKEITRYYEFLGCVDKSKGLQGCTYKLRNGKTQVCTYIKKFGTLRSCWDLKKRTTTNQSSETIEHSSGRTDPTLNSLPIGTQTLQKHTQTHECQLMVDGEMHCTTRNGGSSSQVDHFTQGLYSTHVPYTTYAPHSVYIPVSTSIPKPQRVRYKASKCLKTFKGIKECWYLTYENRFMVCKHQQSRKAYPCEQYNGRVVVDQRNSHQENHTDNKRKRDNTISPFIESNESFTEQGDINARDVQFLETPYRQLQLAGSNFRGDALDELDLHDLDAALLAAQYYDSYRHDTDDDYFDDEVQEYEIPVELFVTESLAFLDHFAIEELRSLQDMLALSHDTDIIHIDLQTPGSPHITRRWDIPKDATSQSMPFTQGVGISPMKREADIKRSRHIVHDADACEIVGGINICNQDFKDGSEKCICMPKSSSMKRDGEVEKQAIHDHPKHEGLHIRRVAAMSPPSYDDRPNNQIFGTPTPANYNKPDFGAHNPHDYCHRGCHKEGPNVHCRIEKASRNAKRIDGSYQSSYIFNPSATALPHVTQSVHHVPIETPTPISFPSPIAYSPLDFFPDRNITWHHDSLTGCLCSYIEAGKILGPLYNHNSVGRCVKHLPGEGWVGCAAPSRQPDTLTSLTSSVPWAASGAPSFTIIDGSPVITAPFITITHRPVVTNTQNSNGELPGGAITTTTIPLSQLSSVGFSISSSDPPRAWTLGNPVSFPAPRSPTTTTVRATNPIATSPTTVLPMTMVTPVSRWETSVSRTTPTDVA